MTDHPTLKPPFRLYLLAGIVALGIAVAWFLVVVWTIESVDQISGQRARTERLEVTVDGEPVIVQYKRGVKCGSMNLRREPLQIDDWRLLSLSYVAHPSKIRWYDGSNWLVRLAGMRDRGTPATLWYLVHDGQANGRAYGVGYHSLTKRVVGYFGRSGFTHHLPHSDDWFPIIGDHGLMGATLTVRSYEPNPDWPYGLLPLLSDGQLWLIDPTARQVKSMLAYPDREATIHRIFAVNRNPAEDIGSALVREPSQSYTLKLMIRGQTTCIVVDPYSGTHSVYPLPASLQRFSFSTIQLRDEQLLLIAERDPLTEEVGDTAVWLKPDGQVARQEVVRRAVYRGIGFYNEKGPSNNLLYALAAPFPAGQAAFAAAITRAELFRNRLDSFGATLWRVLGDLWPAMVLTLIVGGVTATATYRRQRRYALPGAIGWSVFSFFLGLPGWVAYRWHRIWPVWERCPSCRELSARHRDHCSQCGAAFPAPEPTGLEIFA